MTDNEEKIINGLPIKPFADLSEADLIGANLIGADLDFSSLPLWCGTASSTIIIDKRLAGQFLYHACILAQQHIEIPDSIKSFIREHFHRYNEVEELK